MPSFLPTKANFIDIHKQIIFGRMIYLLTLYVAFDKKIIRQRTLILALISLLSLTGLSIFYENKRLNKFLKKNEPLKKFKSLKEDIIYSNKRNGTEQDPPR